MTALLQPIQLTLGAQFGAALSMLHDAIKSCPPTEWDRRVGNWPFWQAAYHVLFYVDFYLSTNEHSFSPQEFHRKEYESFREEPLADENQVIEAVPQEKILGYVLHCHQKTAASLAAETAESLQGPSGFSWYPISRLEFHINNIRHAQHHAAQLSLALRRSSGIDIRWVGTGFREA